ncbi:MAG: carbohydrate porin [Acidobacteriota bacterium]
MKGLWCFVAFFLLFLATENSSYAREALSDSIQYYNLHFQQTIITQGHPAFKAPYSGQNSLRPESEKATSITSTVFLGIRLWRGAALYVNPELAGGTGISGSVGLAGFSNGETFRIGSSKPLVYLARLFLRQVFSLSGKTVKVEDQPNHLQAQATENSITLTAGRFSTADIFDNNDYSHDPRTQFLNWSIMSAGAWDYPADTRGYTWGLSAEYNSSAWAFRMGAFMMPERANGLKMDTNIKKAHGLVLEGEKSYTLNNRKGTLRLLAFYNEGRMGSYFQTIANPAYRMDITSTRKYGRNKFGFSLNAGQEITSDSGFFLRLSWNNGKTETWAFTEIDHSLSFGFVQTGKLWSKKSFQAALAFAVNGISEDHRQYLALGGHGFMLGDGKLNYSNEIISELLCGIKIVENLSLSGDYQFVLNPAYNKDRGPVSIFAVRVHAEF